MDADVIRWIETAWKPARRGDGKAMVAGGCRVTAEVETDRAGWVGALRLLKAGERRANFAAVGAGKGVAADEKTVGMNVSPTEGTNDHLVKHR